MFYFLAVACSEPFSVQRLATGMYVVNAFSYDDREVDDNVLLELSDCCADTEHYAFWLILLCMLGYYGFSSSCALTDCFPVSRQVHIRKCATVMLFPQVHINAMAITINTLRMRTIA